MSALVVLRIAAFVHLFEARRVTGMVSSHAWTCFGMGVPLRFTVSIFAKRSASLSVFVVVSHTLVPCSETPEYINAMRQP